MGPIPGGGTSMSELILSSYPPPPPWYKNFTTSESINREPPPLPDRTYTCFGCPRLAVQVSVVPSMLLKFSKQFVFGFPVRKKRRCKLAAT